MRITRLVYVALSITLVASTQSRATTACPLSIDADFPVTYVDGHIPVVTVQARGQKLRLMLDTGSSETTITEAAYNRLQLDQSDDVPGYSAGGLGGRVDISGFALVDMNFGAVRLKDEVVGILASATPDETGPNAIVGIMG